MGGGGVLGPSAAKAASAALLCFLALAFLPAGLSAAEAPGLYGGFIDGSGSLVTTGFPAVTNVYDGPHSATNSSTQGTSVWPNNRTWVYWGRMRLDGGPVYFAEQMWDYTQVKLDGEVVLESSNYQTFDASACLRPEAGWHDVEIRFGHGGGRGGRPPDGVADMDGVPTGFGVRQDEAPPAAMGDCRYPADPGDGSLFRHDDGLPFADTIIVGTSGLPEGMVATDPAPGLHPLADGQGVTYAAQATAERDGVHYRCAGRVTRTYGEDGCGWGAPATNPATTFEYTHTAGAPAIDLTWLYEIDGYKLAYAPGGDTRGTVTAEPPPDLDSGCYSTGTDVALTLDTPEPDPSFWWNGDIGDGPRDEQTLSVVMDRPRQVLAYAAYAPVFHVVPAGEEPEGGDGSGDSWRNATSDLAAAIAKAGIYQAEVWMKCGRHAISNAIAAQPAVTVRGGFAGDETAASQAAPAERPTILAGDLLGDDFWQPGGATPDEASRVPLWTGDAFNGPAPGDADDFWQPCGGNADDTPVLFTDNGAAVDGFAAEGLTFTAFRQGVADFTGGSSAAMRDCRFLANNTGAHTADAAVLRIKDSAIAVEDCAFIGNCHVAELTSSDITRSAFTNCVFRGNFSRNRGACVRLGGKVSADFEGCVFEDNCAKGDWTCGDNAAAIDQWSGSPVSVRRCLFKGNRVLGYSKGTIYQRGFPTNLKIMDCRFLGNVARPDGSDGTSACISIGNGYIEVWNSYFRGNRVTVEGSLGGSWGYASVLNAGAHCAWFFNCTIVDNAAVNRSSAEPNTGTFVFNNDAAIINCLVDGSRLEGRAHDFAFTGSSKDRACALVNTVVKNGSPGYDPLRFDSTNMTPLIANVAISKLDVPRIPKGFRGYIIEASDDPGPFSATRLGPGGAPVRGISAGSRWNDAGRPVWYAPSRGLYFIYDPEGHPSEPWQRMPAKYYGQRGSPVSADAPVIPDAYGRPRVIGKIAYGPLNPLPGGTILMLK